MEEFVEKFQEFREFLNSKTTEHLISNLTKDGVMVLTVIRDKFEELKLNDSFNM